METASLAHAPEHVQEYDRSKFGMWLFLASEIMFFTGFIGTYIVLRSGAPAALIHESQHELNKILAALNTLVLICSSLTMALGVAASKRGDRGKLCTYLVLTILLATTFLVIKGVEYKAKFDHTWTEEQAMTMMPHYKAYKEKADELEIKNKGKSADEIPDEDKIVTAAPGKLTEKGIGPGTNIFFASYFTMTGFHGLHVIGGIVALLILLVMAGKGKFTAERNAGVELTGLYWHFVDVVWIFLFPILYLI